jgi:(S)-sulfolactate dehydrogenase
MPTIVITEFIDDAARDALAAAHEVHYDPDLHARPEAIIALLGECRALVVRNQTRVDAALLARAPRLEAVGRLGVGLDNIDVAACDARRIAVHAATGANVDSVAEYVVTGTLMLLRGAYQSSAEVLSGAWPRARLIGRETSGKVLGLVGFGAIARATAARARCLGLVVTAHDPFVAADAPAWSATGVRPAAFDELLASSDVVSLHVPLTEGTRHLVDARAIGLMKPGTCLINTARGGIVDERAMADALRHGRLAGAMLDVFEDEPLRAGSHLEGVAGLVLTPHVAGVTRESNVRVGALIAERILSELEMNR